MESLEKRSAFESCEELRAEVRAGLRTLRSETCDVECKQEHCKDKRRLFQAIDDLVEIIKYKNEKIKQLETKWFTEFQSDKPMVIMSEKEHERMSAEARKAIHYENIIDEFGDDNPSGCLAIIDEFRYGKKEDVR